MVVDFTAPRVEVISCVVRALTLNSACVTADDDVCFDDDDEIAYFTVR